MDKQSLDRATANIIREQTAALNFSRAERDTLKAQVKALVPALRGLLENVDWLEKYCGADTDLSAERIELSKNKHTAVEALKPFPVED